jgi:hypothetical protein
LSYAAAGRGDETSRAKHYWGRNHAAAGVMSRLARVDMGGHGVSGVHVRRWMACVDMRLGLSAGIVVRNGLAAAVASADEVPVRADLRLVRAHTVDAHLSGNAHGCGGALVAALLIGAAHEPGLALIVDAALRLVGQPAHAGVAREDAELAVGAVAGHLALRVASLERAHERIVAIAVDGAAARQSPPGRGLARSDERERCEYENRKPDAKH